MYIYHLVMNIHRALLGCAAPVRIQRLGSGMRGWQFCTLPAAQVHGKWSAWSGWETATGLCSWYVTISSVLICDIAWIHTPSFLPGKPRLDCYPSVFLHLLRKRTYVAICTSCCQTPPPLQRTASELRWLSGGQEGKIIRTVLCCVVHNTCAQWYAHTCEQVLNLRVGLGLDFSFVYLFRLNIICIVMLA